MNKQSALINEESHEKIVKENDNVVVVVEGNVVEDYEAPPLAKKKRSGGTFLPAMVFRMELELFRTLQSKEADFFHVMAWKPPTCASVASVPIEGPHMNLELKKASADWDSSYVEMPKDLYQAHLRPGVIFRIHMSEAVLKMQYRNYGEDKDESVIEADVEYLRLTRKVINDEITKFEDLQWLVQWFYNRTELIQEHMCNTRYFAVGTPPTMFTHPEEYMKRLCLFDAVYIDHIPYVIGEDSSLMAAVAPPVLHCDAATCTSVPFIDSLMFDERLPRTNVRTMTRCQASCRAHCRNDPDCLKRCSDRCLRSD